MRLSTDKLPATDQTGVGSQDLLVFLCGLGAVTQVRVIGAFGLSEFLLLPLAAYTLVFRSHILRKPPVPLLLTLAFAWLLSAVVTDLYRESSTTQSLKGAGTVVLWIACLIAMYSLLEGRHGRIRWFVVGVFFSTCISTRYFQQSSLETILENVDDEVILFRSVYVGVLLSGAVALTAIFYRRSFLLTCMLLLSGVACFIYGSRAAGLILAGAGASLPMLTRLSLQKDRRLHRRMWFHLLAIGAVAALGLFAYSYAADSGILGDRERERYLQQSGGNVGLLQARGEFASALVAVSDSPILGHGSYALDTNEYRRKGAEILGLTWIAGLARHDEMIPGHSHIWQFWIWHGVLGGIFWIYVLIFVVRFMKSHLLMEPEYLAILLLICLGFCWNILFSPFGGRPAVAANLAFLILIYQKHRSSTSQPEPRHGTLSTWHSQ